MHIYDPNSAFRIRWNCMVALAIMYLAFSIPFRLTFGITLSGGYHYILDFTADLILALDILVNLRTAYLKDGELLTSPRQIRTHYLQRQGRLDSIALFPLDWLLVLSGVASPWMITFFRLPRLLKLKRFFHYFRLWEGRYRTSPSLIRICKLLAGAFIVNHWVGCGWYSVAWAEGFAENTWFAKEGLIDADIATSYIRSVYWSLTTMTTVGYGDITPETNPETLFTLLVMVMGVSMYAYVIGDVSTLIANIDARQTLFRQKMDAVNQYMAYHDLPHELRQRVRRSCEYYWSCNHGMGVTGLLNDVSPPLRTEIALYLNRDIIEKVPLFKGCSIAFIESLVTRLHAQVIGPEEFICRKGDVGQEMYFISKGAVAILDEDDQESVVSTLAEGSYFGEVALLYTERRTATVKALTYCHLFVLSKTDLDELLQLYPEFAEHMHQNARRNYERAKLDLTGSLWRPRPEMQHEPDR